MIETWERNSNENNLTVFKISSSFLMSSEGIEIYSSLKFSLDDLQTTFKTFYHWE